MSGDEELDNLLYSISNSSKKKKGKARRDSPVDLPRQPSTKSGESGQTSGIDPLEVVELSDQERKVVTWLSRHRRSSFEDIQKAVEIPLEDLQSLLDDLLKEKRINSVERNGKTLYSAPIHGRASRRLRGFPEDLWKKAGLDDE